MVREGLIREVGNDVAVIGGGVSGILAALGLAERGMDVTLFEASQELGGIFRELNYILYNSEVQKKEIFLSGLLEKLEGSSVKVILGKRVKDIEGFIGDFNLRLSDGEKLKASQVVVATGLSYSSPSSGVLLSQLELETFIKRGLPEGVKVAFFIDKEDWSYKLNTVNVFKQALLLLEKFKAKVFLFSRDFKVSFDGGEAIFRLLRERGAIFFKVSEFPQAREVEGKVRMEFYDELFFRKEKVEVSVDYLVLPFSAEKVPENGELLKYLRIKEGEFYQEANPQLCYSYPSFKKGVYFVGSCVYPMPLEELTLDVARVVSWCATINERLRGELDRPYAKVDPKKCALCLTCLRSCPSGSITFKVYPGEKNVYYVPYLDDGRSFEAAYVDPTSCFGCGICASECPAKAITLVGLEDEAIYKQTRC